MLIQRMVSAASLSLMAWTIYHLKFTFTMPVLVALGVYVLGIIVLAIIKQRRTEGTEHAAGLSTAVWSAIWTLLSSGALFGVFGIAVTWYKYAAQGTLTSFWLWMLHLIGVTILFLAVLFFAGLHIALQEVARKAQIKHWYDAPVIGFMLVCKRGGSYLTAGTFVLLAIWVAFLVDFFAEHPYSSFIAFLLILLSFDWLMKTRSVNTRRSTVESSSAKGAAFAKWTGLTFVFLFILFYCLLAQSIFALVSQLLAFIIIAFVLFMILLICLGLIKIRLFAIVKWLMILFIYPLFAACVLYMSSFSQS